MKGNALLGTHRKRKLIGGGLAFFACYLLLLVIVFLMIILNDPRGWTDFVVDRYADMLSLVVSIFFLFAVTYLYYYFENASFFGGFSNIALWFTLVVGAIVLSYFVGRFVSIYARPLAMYAILVNFLFNRRQALFQNFIFSFLMFVIDVFTNNFHITAFNSEIYASLMLSIVGGTFAVFIASRVRTRGGILMTGVVLIIPTVVLVMFFKIPDLTNGWIDYFAAVGFRILGCVLSACLTLVLLPAFEFVFNRLTVFRLRELTGANAPLLRRLKEEAPGTFNHSILVAQLCETCAMAIGEDTELARAAAYLHDIGKLRQPDCFTENQSDYNVHDELTPELSADIIRSHAREGYAMLTKARMPQIIADVAREHHGTMPIKYFYDKANRISGGDADIKNYSYEGPTPRSRIAAIVMIADSSEAAVRALPDRSPENVEKVVRGIIEERMDLDQFAECDITQQELTVIKQAIVDALSSVHHHRVAYPAIRFNRDKQAVAEEEKHE